MMGSMGLALPLAIGFSRRAGSAAMAVEGDGNALMGLSGMALAEALGGRRTGFIHVRTAADSGPPPPRVPFHPAEITRRFTARFRTSDTGRNEVAL
jgi:thiamine pyrophosphate-dependent acetolactate synthase large subunit-like protein